MIKLKDLLCEEKYTGKISREFDNVVTKYLDALETYENGITRQKMLSTHYFSTTNERDRQRALYQLKLHQKEVEKNKKAFEKEEENYQKALEKQLEKNLTPQFRNSK
jgi:uncharacterized membrane protein YgaE (UPF0421/DUF939 family)